MTVSSRESPACPQTVCSTVRELVEESPDRTLCVRIRSDFVGFLLCGTYTAVAKKTKQCPPHPQRLCLFKLSLRTRPTTALLSLAPDPVVFLKSLVHRFYYPTACVCVCVCECAVYTVCVYSVHVCVETRVVNPRIWAKLD